MTDENLTITQEPSNWVRQRIVREQGYRCFYCGLRFGSATPHFDDPYPIPVKLTWELVDRTFVALCGICKRLKGTMVFPSAESARRYVLDKRRAEGYTEFSVMTLDYVSGGICGNCGHEFTARKPWQKYCSPKCRVMAYEERHPRI